MPKIPDASSLGTASPQPQRSVVTGSAPRMVGYGEAFRDVGNAMLVKAEEENKKRQDFDLARAQNEYLRRKIATDLEIEKNNDYTAWEDIARKGYGEAMSTSLSLISDPATRERARYALEETNIKALGEVSFKRQKRYQENVNAEVYRISENIANMVSKGQIEPDVGLRITSQALDTTDLNPEQKQALKSKTRDDLYAYKFMNMPMLERQFAVKGVTPVMGKDFKEKFDAVEGRAKNKDSTAEGKYQFIASTWLNMVKRYKPAVANGKSDQELLSLRTKDPVLVEEMFDQLVSDNTKILSNSLGRNPTDGELYLAHQQGPEVAAAMIKNPDLPAISVISKFYKDPAVARDALLNNRGKMNMTAGQFASMWSKKFDGAPGEYIQTGSVLDVLSPEKRQAVLNKHEIEWKQYQSELRHKLSADLSNSISNASVGNDYDIISNERFYEAYEKADEAEKFIEDYKDNLNHATVTASISVMSNDEIRKLLSAPVDKNSPDVAREKKQKDELVSIASQVIKFRSENPVEAAHAYGLAGATKGEIPYIDIARSDPSDLEGQFLARKTIAANMKEQYGVPYLPWTKSEVDGLKNFIDLAETPEKTQILKKIGDVLSPEERKSLAREVDKTDRSLAVLLATDTIAAEKIMLGAASDVKDDVVKPIVEIANVMMADTIHDPSTFGMFSSAIKDYVKYKKFMNSSMSDESIAEEAVEAVLSSKIITVEPSMSRDESRIFAFKLGEKDSDFVNEGTIERAIQMADDADLFDIAKSFPVNDANDKISAEALFREARMYSVNSNGDVVFKVKDDNGDYSRVIMSSKGGQFRLNLKSLIVKKKVGNVSYEINERTGATFYKGEF